MNEITLTEIKLVQESWGMVQPIADDAIQMFYDRLFLLDPSLRSLFAEDLTEQRKKLAQMITMAVTNLDRPEQLIGAVRELGARHVGYGVRAVHYDTVGQALLWTLGMGLGDLFTPAVEAAWIKVYTLLSTLMQEGAAEATEEAVGEAVL